MRLNERAKSVTTVLAVVLLFGLVVPLLNGVGNSGATGNQSVVGGQSVVKKPVKKPVVKPVVKPVLKPVVKVRVLAVEVTFAAPNATLSGAAKGQLTKLAKKLVKGATVTIHGYSKNSFKLSNRRALAVEQYLKSKTKVKLKVKLIPSLTAKNAADVRVEQS